jgi:putative ABC transport system ATP-binding protein
LSLSHPTLDSILERLEIRPLLRKLPRELSVGQQQRVSIGRALAHGPELVLADEPTSALDPRLAGRVLELLLELAARLGVTAVVATHEHWRVRELGLREIAAQPWDGPTRFGSRFGE